MIEPIAENLYLVRIPLPNSPLQSLNSYFIKGPQRNLIIDTGMNREACFAAMQQALARLEVDLSKTDFFITHLHADHLGLTSRLHQAGTRIYFNRPDAARISEEGRWAMMFEFGRQNGFPAEALEAILRDHPGHKYRQSGDLDFTLLGQNDQIQANGYSFVCVQTPGHTQGHLCLYEPAKKILIAGDHVLDTITPNIQLWDWEENPLAQYLQSLRKILALDIELVLPGHRGLIRDHRQRIAQLRQHHEARLAEVLRILQAGEMDAFAVASRMSWDIGPDWDSFPVAQWWFATGEALSHLKYLEAEGRLRQTEHQGRLQYSLVH